MEEEKKIKNQERLEKKFHKTKFGKFMKILAIITISLTIIGLILTGIENILTSNNIEVNKYQSIFKFGSFCKNFSDTMLDVVLIFYVFCLPEWMSDYKNK